MNILTLSIKQKYFDEILAGKKTHEYREIRPTNAKKYITYLCGGKEYPADAELPEEGEIELKPIKYDAIKLLTGAYTGKRPYIIVEVKAAEAVILTDENGNDIVYEYQGEESCRTNGLYFGQDIREIYRLICLTFKIRKQSRKKN